MDATNKPWSRPWTTQEMVDHASDWSLAADVGLFKHLEQFADNMMKKAEETNDNLEKHVQHLQSISQTLDIEKCRFLSLQNTQFIENRVYEDDETDVGGIDADVDTTTVNKTNIENVNGNKTNRTDADGTDINNKSENKKSSPIDRKQIMTNSVLKGLAMLDKYYDKVDVPASDSEEDTTSSFILRPKDPYLNRPLPYIIGSEEWHKKWHVGLLESSSESEDEKVSDRYSDSESDDNLPVTNRLYKIPASDAISEDSDKVYGSHPIAHSTSKDSYKSGETLYKSEHSYKSGENSYISGGNEETDSIFQQPQVGTNIFAEELAAKLGDVLTSSNTNKGSANSFNKDSPNMLKKDSSNILNKATLPEADINRKVIQTKPVSNFIGDFFDDEPPPLDENNDTKDRNDLHGLFSGGSGLFDDDDEDTDSLWNQTPVARTIQTKKLQPSQLQDADNPINEATINKLTSPSIFDENEDDLFTQPKNTSKGHISQDPVKDNVSIKKAKKPTGGVAVVPNLFLEKKDLNILKQRSMSTDSMPEDTVDEGRVLFKEVEAVETVHQDKNQPKTVEPSLSITEDSVTKKEVPSKNISPKVSLFDDDESDLFLSDDIFSNITTKKFTSDLFSSDDLFAPSDIKKKPSESNVEYGSSSSTRKVFYTDILEDSPPPIEKKTPQIQKQDPPIHNNTSAQVEKRKPSVEKKTQLIENEPPPPVENEPSFHDIRKAAKKPIVSLFGEDNDIEEDLFGSYNPTQILKQSRKDSASNIFDKFDNKFVEGEDVSVHRTESPKIEVGRLNTDSQSIFKTEDVSSPKSEDEFASIIQSTVQKVHSNYQDDDLFEEPPPLPSSTGGLSKPNDNSELEINYDDWDTKSDIFEDFTFNNKKLDTSKGAAGKDEEICFSNDEQTNISDGEKTEKNDIISNDGNIGVKEKLKVIQTPNVAVTAPKPAIRPSKIQLSNDFMAAAEPPSKAEVRSPPGKLKHNLNINVNALLPGLGPPKKKETIAAINVDHSESSLKDNKTNINDSEATIKDKEANIKIKESNVINNNEDSSKNSSSNSDSVQNRSEKRTENTATSIENYGEPEILYNVTKDRAKPIKRRPSTRRGRQERLRKSVIDINYNEPEDDITIKNEVITKHTETKYNVITDQDVKEKVIQKTTFEPKTKEQSEQMQKQVSSDADSFEDIFDSIAKASQSLASSTRTRNAPEQYGENKKSEQTTGKFEQTIEKSKVITEKSKEIIRKPEQISRKSEYIAETKTRPVASKDENKAPLQNKVDFDDLFGDDLFSDLAAKTVTDKNASAKNVSADNLSSRNMFKKDVSIRNELTKELSNKDVLTNDLTAKYSSSKEVSSGNISSKHASTNDLLTKDLFATNLLSKDLSAHNISGSDQSTNDLLTNDVSTKALSTTNLPTKSASTTNRASKYERERQSVNTAGKNTEQESRKSSRNFLFDEDSNDDSDDALFAGRRKSTPPQQTTSKAGLKAKQTILTTKDLKKKDDYKPKVSLFGDDDDGDSDDIFSTNKMQTKSGSSKLESSQHESSQHGSSKFESTKPGSSRFGTMNSGNPKSGSSKSSSTKKSLFDDENDMEDDIFGSTSVRKISFSDDTKVPEGMQRRKSKTNTVKKLEGTVVTDPLDAFRD